MDQYVLVHNHSSNYHKKNYIVTMPCSVPPTINQ